MNTETYFKKTYFVFNRIKKSYKIQWNDIKVRVNGWIFVFWMNFPFNKLHYQDFLGQPASSERLFQGLLRMAWYKRVFSAAMVVTQWNKVCSMKLSPFWKGNKQWQENRVIFEILSPSGKLQNLVFYKYLFCPCVYKSGSPCFSWDWSQSLPTTSRVLS